MAEPRGELLKLLNDPSIQADFAKLTASAQEGGFGLTNQQALTKILQQYSKAAKAEGRKAPRVTISGRGLDMLTGMGGGGVVRTDEDVARGLPGTEAPAGPVDELQARRAQVAQEAMEAELSEQVARSRGIGAVQPVEEFDNDLFYRYKAQFPDLTAQELKQLATRTVFKSPRQMQLEALGLPKEAVRAILMEDMGLIEKPPARARMAAFAHALGMERGEDGKFGLSTEERAKLLGTGGNVLEQAHARHRMDAVTRDRLALLERLQAQVDREDTQGQLIDEFMGRVQGGGAAPAEQPPLEHPALVTPKKDPLEDHERKSLDTARKYGAEPQVGETADMAATRAIKERISKRPRTRERLGEALKDWYTVNPGLPVTEFTAPDFPDQLQRVAGESSYKTLVADLDKAVLGATGVELWNEVAEFGENIFGGSSQSGLGVLNPHTKAGRRIWLAMDAFINANMDKYDPRVMFEVLTSNAVLDETSATDEQRARFSESLKEYINDIYMSTHKFGEPEYSYTYQGSQKGFVGQKALPTELQPTDINVQASQVLETGEITPELLKQFEDSGEVAPHLLQALRNVLQVTEAGVKTSVEDRLMKLFPTLRDVEEGRGTEGVDDFIAKRKKTK